MTSTGHAHGNAEHIDYASENKKHFDANAKEVDANPVFQQLARQVREAIFRIHGSLFDPSSTELLDFACGTGLLSFEILPRVKTLLGVDISSGMVERFNERATELGVAPDKMRAVDIELSGDGTELDGAKFDVVLCSLAYHHFSSIADTTRLLASFVKPGGSLLVVDFMKRDEMSRNELDEEHRHIVSHVGGFTEAQMREVFERAGLGGFEFEFVFTTKILQRDFDVFVARGIRPQDAA